ncbi:MAG TPA: pyrroline-5-carboxylate reductase [Bacteroidales bacterium]|nr:pyrroline-5-carboxylate reductase [Bacteroidales bacterium]
MTNHFRIAILGGGNLGNSLATGLLATGHFQANDLIVTRRKIQFLNHLQQQNVRITSDNRGAVEESRFVLMTVKPHQMESLLQEIQSVIIPEKHILVSSVTGFPIRRIRSICGNVPVVRIMPNTAAAIGESMTCLAAQEDDQGALTEVKELFDLLGKTLVIGEELMEASTVLGACGIAFALRFLRAMTQAGIEIGFPSETAQFIAAQTLRGAAGLVLKEGQHPEKEIDKVTTPMGITISGLNEMEHNGFSSALIKGILTSFHKIENLPPLAGKE